MGCIFLGIGLIAFLVGMALGTFGLYLHARALRVHGRGSWRLYSVIACAVALAFLAAAKAVGSQASPSNEYGIAMYVVMLISAAPGAGLLAGTLAIFKRA